MLNMMLSFLFKVIGDTKELFIVDFNFNRNFSE